MIPDDIYQAYLRAVLQTPPGTITEHDLALFDRLTSMSQHGKPPDDERIREIERKISILWSRNALM